MIHATPLLAEFGSVEKFVITALAVAGGFLIGFLLTNVIVRLLFRFVWKKTPPEKLVRFLRFAGGVGAAILVYLLLMGEGGFGLGGGGGGPTGDTGKEKNQNPQNGKPPPSDPNQEKTKPKVDEPRSGIVTVYLLSNTAPAMRMFRIGEDGQPLTWDELLKQIDKLSENKQEPIVKIEIGDLDYSVLAESRLVSELNNRGIRSTPPIPKKPPSKN